MVLLFEWVVEDLSKNHPVTAAHIGSDTVTGCSYTTLADSTAAGGVDTPVAAAVQPVGESDTACGCEHARQNCSSRSRSLKARALHMGAVCDECALTHVRDYLVSLAGVRLSDTPRPNWCHTAPGGLPACRVMSSSPGQRGAARGNSRMRKALHDHFRSHRRPLRALGSTLADHFPDGGAVRFGYLHPGLKVVRPIIGELHLEVTHDSPSVALP